MALSYSQSIGDGTTVNFAVPFSYLAKDHVSVHVDGVQVPFTWINPAMVRLTSAPAAGAVVEVRRTTPNDKALVDFQDGSTLTETHLDTATLQVFFLAQESFDRAQATLGITNDGQFSAINRRIANMADPVNQQDAVTKRWAETAMSSQLAQATAANTGAQSARTAAEAARDVASTKAAEATSAASTATTKATQTASDAAATSADRTVVATDKATVAADKAAAAASATLAQNWAAKASGEVVPGQGYSARKYAADAAASAAAAALFDPSTYYDKTTSDSRFVRTTGNGSVSGNFSVGGGLTFAKNTQLAPGTDLDTVQIPGWYDGNSFVNAPVSGVSNAWFYVEVQRHSNSGTYVLQRATALNHSGYRTWVRACNSGVWQPWREAWDSGNLDTWAMQPIGMPIPIFDHIPGVPTPPTDKAYRYVKLTAGLTGAGGYNNGILTSETVSGSAPLVNATAVISLSGSPLDGQTLRLINTERRFIRAGDVAGSVQDDAFQAHWHAAVLHNLRTWQPVAGSGPVVAIQGDGTNSDSTAAGVRTAVSDGSSGTPRISTETRPRNIWATYYLRIK